MITGIFKKYHQLHTLTNRCTLVKHVLFSLTIRVSIYNDDILYIIYYFNILYCYRAENKKNCSRLSKTKFYY